MTARLFRLFLVLLLSVSIIFALISLSACNEDNGGDKDGEGVAAKSVPGDNKDDEKPKKTSWILGKIKSNLGSGDREYVGWASTSSPEEYDKFYTVDGETLAKETPELLDYLMRSLFMDCAIDPDKTKEITGLAREIYVIFSQNEAFVELSARDDLEASISALSTSIDEGECEIASARERLDMIVENLQKDEAE